MKKPEKVIVKHWDYYECADYIAEKLGYDLEDTLGKYSTEGEVDKNTEYRDFWHFLCDHNSVHNPCYIYIGRDLLDRAEPWQKEIINAFIEEFGDEEEYWVEW